MKVENLINSRGNKVANQFIIYDGNKIVFQSYDSTIAEVDVFHKTITFGRDWNYSTTTSKHRNHFFDSCFYELQVLNNTKAIEEAINNGYVIDKLGGRWDVSLSF